MSTSERETIEGIRLLSPSEAAAAFDEAVRAYLDMSGDEFIRRWDAGEFDEIADQPGFRHIMYLAGLLPFGRQKS